MAFTEYWIDTVAGNDADGGGIGDQWQTLQHFLNNASLDSSGVIAHITGTANETDLVDNTGRAGTQVILFDGVDSAAFQQPYDSAAFWADNQTYILTRNILFDYSLVSTGQASWTQRFYQTCTFHDSTFYSPTDVQFSQNFGRSNLSCIGCSFVGCDPRMYGNSYFLGCYFDFKVNSFAWIGGVMDRCLIRGYLTFGSSNVGIVIQNSTFIADSAAPIMTSFPGNNALNVFRNNVFWGNGSTDLVSSATNIDIIEHCYQYGCSSVNLTSMSGAVQTLSEDPYTDNGGTDIVPSSELAAVAGAGSLTPGFTQSADSGPVGGFPRSRLTR